MTVHEFRKKVKAAYPSVRVRVRTVSFQDLARCSRLCLSIDGDTDIEQVRTINAWAKEAGILPDGNIRGYWQPAWKEQ